MLVAVAVALAAGCIGAWVLRLTRSEARHPLDSLLAAVAIGNGVMGIVGLTLAALQALRPGIVWAVLAGAAAPGVVGLGRLARAAWERRRPLGAWDRVVVGALALHGLAILAMVLAPSVTGDQTKYQLAYPRLYAEAGGLIATPWTFWGQQQFLENFVFAMAFTVGDETVAHLMHALIGLVAIAGAARLVTRWLAPTWGWAAALLLATQPMTWSMFGANGSDLPVLAYTVLAVAAFVAWRGGEPSGLARAALLAGLAGGAKVMGLLTPGLLGLGALVAARRAGVARVLRVGVLFGCLAGTLAAAPYVRNAVEVGNPLHPFGHGVFQGRGWSDEAAAYLDKYYRQYRVERARRRGGAPYEGAEVLRFPWDLTLYPESFERSARWALDIGPSMLAMLPAAVWFATRSPAARVVVVFGATYLLIIAAGAWAHPRYVLPGVVALTTAGIGGLVRMMGPAVGRAVVAVTVAGHLVVTGRLAGAAWPDQVAVAIGRMSPDAYLHRHSDRYRFWRAVDDAMPAGGRVLVLGKIPHPHFIGHEFVLGSYLEQTLIDYRRLADAEALLARARELGATHVAFELGDLERAGDAFERRVVALWRELRARLGTPLVHEGNRELHQLPGLEGP